MRFTCVTIGFDGRNRTTERTAQSAETAAEACATAIHNAYYVDSKSRAGQDSHGSFQEFTVKAGRRAHSAIRVYEAYKY